MDSRIKAWRKLAGTDASYQVANIAVLESDVFAAQTIELDRATAVVGAHGTGKTTLLRLIQSCLGGWSDTASPPFFAGQRTLWGADELALGGIFDVTLKTPSGIVSRRVDVTERTSVVAEAWQQLIKRDFWVEYVSALSAFGGLQMIWQEYRRVVDNQPHHAYRYSAPELRTLRNILGRAYSHAEVRTVLMDSIDGYDYFEPHIRATVANREIDSAQMSLGEIWVHYVLGYVLREEHPSDLLLLDEPESFLAQRGQRSFIDEIARLALARDRQLIFATHAPEMYLRMPLANVRVCVQHSGGIEIFQPESAGQVADAVGLEVPVRGIILVEDEFAARVLRGLCEALAPGLERELDVVPSGGASKVVAACDVLAHASRVRVHGVLDGDERHRRGEAATGILFLPGARDPESELLDAAEREAERVAALLGRTRGDVLLAAQACRDLDHQYQIPRFARGLARDEAVVTSALIDAWLASDKTRAAAMALVEAIARTSSASA